MQACPERYRLKQIEGWRARENRVDLIFGHVVGSALELFYKGVIEAGLTHDDALCKALQYALNETWDHEADKPLLGAYVDVWRCAGEAPYLNASGRKVKCPHAYKTKPPRVGPAPQQCGACGGEVEAWSQWVPEKKPKDRLAVLRAIVAYAEEMKGGILAPISYGTEAMLEVKFLVPFHAMNGVEYWLAGWFDKVATMGPDRVLITDYKTTGASISKLYWEQYAPNTQVGFYNLVARHVLPPDVAELFEGVAIEAIQILAEGVRYEYREFPATVEQNKETELNVAFWIAQAGIFHESGYYPRNPQSCRWCEFKAVCSALPGKRDDILAERFERRRWNPLTRTAELTIDAEAIDAA